MLTRAHGAGGKYNCNSDLGIDANETLVVKYSPASRTLSLGAEVCHVAQVCCLILSSKVSCTLFQGLFQDGFSRICQWQMCLGMLKCCLSGSPVLFHRSFCRWLLTHMHASALDAVQVPRWSGARPARDSGGLGEPPSSLPLVKGGMCDLHTELERIRGAKVPAFLARWLLKGRELSKDVRIPLV